MQKEIDATIRSIIALKLRDYPSDYRMMIEYQMGLDVPYGNTQLQGKRLRPLFVLLACDLLGVDWRNALPAAAAVELLHNFSLIHDDIQDTSDTRRGRDTIWKKWGIALAINAGDAMLNLAYLSIFNLREIVNEREINDVLLSLENTCLLLTKGQHLDMVFEKEEFIPIESYWQMIECKTATLISACFEIGAIVGDADNEHRKTLSEIGKTIGMAFQIQDDYLGIWGDETQTGKSIYSDLMNRKKTYPVILGLQKKLKFSSSWISKDSIDQDSAKLMANELEIEGVKEEVINKYKELYASAWEKLNLFHFEDKKIQLIQRIVNNLEQRTK